MENGFIWRDAEVTYPDWKGTAQLDQRRTARGIEEIIGLDRDAWMIVGIDIGGGESGQDLHVVAIDRNDVPEGGDVLPRIAEANGGEIPVTEFLVHNVNPYEVLRAVTHMFELRLRLARTVGIPMRVTRQADVPEQR